MKTLMLYFLVKDPQTAVKVKRCWNYRVTFKIYIAHRHRPSLCFIVTYCSNKMDTHTYWFNPSMRLEGHKFYRHIVTNRERQSTLVKIRGMFVDAKYWSCTHYNNKCTFYASKVLIGRQFIFLSTSTEKAK